MDPSALIMIGACLALIDEISKSITLEQKQHKNNNKEKELALSSAECKELHGTITCTKTALSSLSSLSSSSSPETPPPSPSICHLDGASTPPTSSPSLSRSSPLTSECTIQSCISGIQANLSALHKLITQHDTNNKNRLKTFNARRLKMFQLDFSLRQRADQLAALFLNDKVFNIITDLEGKEFWDTCFGQVYL